jgi:hypothetical protein
MQSDDAAYAGRLAHLSSVWWKRALDVQRPYRWHLEWLRLGRTLDVGCVAFNGEMIVGTRSRCYRYRRHSKQATATLSKDGLRFQEELDLFREVAQRASDIGWTRVASTARSRTIYRLNALFSGKLSYVFS